MSDYDAMRSMEARMEQLERKMKHHSSDLFSLSERVNENNIALAEFIELGKSLKVGLKVLGFVERAAVFTTKMCLGAAALWGVWQLAVRQAIGKIL